ncbi:MAG: histidine kinase dimerization/phospho-acceptor domain-containing protein [Syntrophomonadaceae bacterium]|jgi:nitrogen-specific signal transduction histidine kinase
MQSSLILDKIPLGIIVFDESQQISYMNSVAVTCTQNTNDFLLEAIKQLAERTFEKLEPIEKIVKYSTVDDFWVWKVRTDLFNDSLSQVLVVIQDETVNSQLEQTILKAEKLAVAGQLAIGSLVEIRNPLTSARGFCQLIENSEAHQEYIEIISKELEQIQRIVSSCSSITYANPSNNLEVIYRKFFSSIHDRVSCFKLMMINDIFDDLMVTVAEEQINTVINNLMNLVINWLDTNICITINSEVAKEADYLELNVRVRKATNQTLIRPGNIDDSVKCLTATYDNIEFKVVDSNTLAFTLRLPIFIPQYRH